MKGKLIILFFVLMPTTVLAQEIYSMSIEEFYQVEENKNMYSFLEKNGKVDEAREMLKINCLKQAKEEAEKEYCKCMGPIIDRADGKMIVYDSVVSYKSFLAEVRAKQSGNEDEYLRLRQLDAKREGLSKQYEKYCGKI
ncbi:hypothetical protein [Marinobacterium lacunae]|uniref:hypothetical protein n=1 Tax=Marinobacterium lacunae TaxID=1232683 RepID=UPI000569EA0D|nr:hypothetical protein [Marinobacterium lacunae]